jgi:diguanylate cyclase (GGDEF)-like protein
MDSMTKDKEAGPSGRGRRGCAGLLGGVAVLAALAGPARAAAKPLRFERFSLEQGLSQTTVLSMHQDSRGFMWFGTEDGLNRFDGVSFTTYQHDARDASSLPNNMVWAIAEDAAGDLWIGTEGGGVSRWDRRTDRFVHLGAPATPAISAKVRALHLTSDGAVWIGTKDAGLFRLDPRTNEVRSFRHAAADPTSLSHDGVYAIAAGRGGELWVGTDGGLNRLDPVSGRVERHLHDPGRTDSLPSDRIRALAEDADGRLWVGTYGGLGRLDAGGDRFVNYRHDAADADSLSHDRVRTLLADADGRLWVGTDGGLDLMERPRESFRHYRHEPAEPTSLGDDNVMSLFRDRGGLIWVGTRTAGVHKANPATWAFGHRTQSPSDPEGLAARSVTGFAQDASGRVWIGTFGGGLHALDRLTGEARRYRPRAGTVLSDRVMALAADPQGGLWVGTMDRGLARLDPATGAARHYRHDPKDAGTLGADGVMALAFDREGALWVGTYGGGLNRLDAASGRFTRFQNDPAEPRSLSSNIVTSIAEDPSGLLWVGTDGAGLNRLDPESGVAVRFRHDPRNAASLGSDSVFALHLDGEGRLWVGTRGAGLAVLEPGPAQTAFRHVTEAQGLPNDVVYGIVPDGRGQLWLSTNNGLACLDPRTGEVKSYDVSHGLQSGEFNFGAHLRTAGGEMLFGGVNGFNAFRPERVTRNASAPPVVLTSFLKFNRPVLGVGPVAQLPGVDLGYRDDVVTFEFAALDYAAPGRNRYAYRLEGFESEWIDLGSLRRVTYTNLPPGSFRLRVRAANSDGVWNEQGLSLPVRVEAPPWRRWWAYLGYGVLVAGLAGAFLQAQKRKLQREERYSRRLEEEVEQRTEELAVRNADLQETNRKLAEASLTDSLTGLRNRRFLFEQVSRDAELVRRRYLALKEGSAPRPFDLSFVMIDLDNFKQINDTCGHAAGDAVLKRVREVLERTCRISDVLIRWGGDEFLLVGRDNDPEQVSAVAERIRSEIEAAAYEVGEGQITRTSCSVGYACYPFQRDEPDLYSWEDVLGLADAALYSAKTTRNAWVGYLSGDKRPDMQASRFERMDPKALLEAGALRVVSSRGAEPAGSSTEERPAEVVALSQGRSC